MSLTTTAAAAALGVDVTLTTGPIRGQAQEGVLAFKGIPYAEPPVGDLRWRAPRPARAWTGVRDVAAYGRPCFAAPMPGPPPKVGPSEDCLTLNVWTAAAEATEARPVMVWIHGGGFEFGSSFMPPTDGARLASKGVVVVSLNYRLGVFGFLAHEELDREGGASGNFGLQDQIEALRWVRANIARFGGDPDNVTLFGESAGAHAIGLLMASPLTKGLFHRAIGESGAFWESEHGPIATRAEARARGQALVAKLGAKSIGELRAIPAEALHKETAWDFTRDPGATAFAPSVDGQVIPREPAQIYGQGQQAPVSLLAGWNDAEFSFFMSRALPHGDAAEFRAAAEAMFGKDRMPAFLAAYPASTNEEAARSAALLIGDLIISQQAWEWVGAQARLGGPRVYAYEYGYQSPYSPVALHTAEMSFVFGNLLPSPFGPPVPHSEGDRAFSDMMMSYWVNFARSGDPNGAGLPVWPHYAGAGSNVMRLAAHSQAQAEIATPRFRFIQSLRRDDRLPECWRRGACAP